MSIHVDFDRVNTLNGKILKEYFFSIQDLSKRYNRIFHGFGIIQGYLSNCEIEIVHAKPPYHFRLLPGAIIDKEGNLIEIHEPLECHLNMSGHANTSQIFLYLNIMVNKIKKDELLHLIEYKPELIASLSELQGVSYIEVARILLEDTIHEIKNAKNPDLPQPGEIDRRYVKFIQITPGYLNSAQKLKVLEGLDERRRLINHLQFLDPVTEKIPQLLDFKFLLIAFQLRFQTEGIPVDRIKELFSLFIFYEIELIDLLKKQLSDQVHLMQILTHIMGILDSCKRHLFNPGEKMVELILEHYFGEINDLYRRIFTEFRKNFDFYAHSCSQFDKIIIIEDQKYRKVKEIEFDNPESKKKQGVFTFPEGESPWESSYPLAYADGSKLNSVVVTFKQPYIELELEDLTGGKDVILFLGVPAQYASIPQYVALNNQTRLEFQLPSSLNGNAEGGVNKFLIIPSTYIKQNKLKLKIFSKNDSEMYLVKMWIYQKM